MKMTLRIHSRLKTRLVGAVREATDAVMVRAAPFAVDALSRVADAKLHDTAGAYKEGLRDAVQVSGGALKIELIGLTKDLEIGYPARDLKLEMLNSSSAKQGKSGKYVDVPFKHVMSRGPKQSHGVTAAVKSKVQTVVRAERSQARLEGREQRSPLRVTGSMPGGTNVQQRYGKRGKAEPWLTMVSHKTSIFSNMIRTKVGKSGKYSTIRRISENSDPQSWWHPGFKGINALKDIKTDLRNVMRQMYKQELSRKGMKSR